MRITTRISWDIESGRITEHEWYEYDGPVALCNRSAQSAASNAVTTAQNTAAGYGAGASTIGSQLVPYLSRQLQNPSGLSQQDIGQQLTAGLAGAGGSNAGLAGAASKNAATSRNPMGFSSALDSMARSRDKAAAGTSEGIVANNANVKLQQQSQAAKGLSGLYGMDVNGQNAAAGQQASDVNAETNAGNSGWLQQAMGIGSMVGGMAGGAGGLMTGLYGNKGALNGCWIAAEIFGGWDEPRTVLVRNWLNTEYRKTFFGSLVMRFYLAFGERIAAAVKKNKWLRTILTPLFHLALRKAGGR